MRRDAAHERSAPGRSQRRQVALSAHPYAHRLIRMRMVTWTDLPWEARYNAACFYALRLAGGVPTAARQGVIERALRNLAQAIRESGGELTQSIITADPDMAYFRDAKPDTNAA